MKESNLSSLPPVIRIETLIVRFIGGVIVGFSIYLFSLSFSFTRRRRSHSIILLRHYVIESLFQGRNIIQILEKEGEAEEEVKEEEEKEEEKW